MRKNKNLLMALLACAATLLGCHNQGTPMFTPLSSAQTGVGFVNQNEDRDSLSILDYLYFYNGAGVAIGDVNNDGLPDVYFTSNTGGNKLYLNKGRFKFEDITKKAGVAGQPGGWTTGVTMADVNGDGLLDIYVCSVGNYNPRDNNGGTHIYFPHAKNQLFINNGNGTFTESATKYGLATEGYNNQAVFFDYDKDGDLDMFLLQQSTHQNDSYGDLSFRSKYSEESGGKLYRNDGGHFTDVTKGSGIYASALGYGLGVSVGDMNHDGYDDIYVGNDFHENDYYYVNQGDGTFKEMNAQAFGHESKFSMGNDMADINHDGWLDIMTVDMLPQDEKVLKSSLVDDPLGLYLYKRSFGFNYQSVRNCLQLNTGRGNKFSEIGLYSGVSATDWSWGPLFADFNLDGTDDIFISNGIKKRPNDLDYIKFISGLPQHHADSGIRVHDKDMLNHLPPGNWHNYIYQGNTDLTFTDQSANWGFGKATLSQGSAYADLDGDGALDLVTNNMNEQAGIYRNNARQQNNNAHYLTVQLKGRTPNTFGIGSKVFLFAAGKLQYQELQVVRGFISSSEPLLHYGLGETAMIDSLVILWPDNTRQSLYNIKANQKLVLAYDKKLTDTIANHFAFVNSLLHTPSSSGFTDITAQSGINYVHKENVDFNDFGQQWYIPHQLSTQGPKIAVADVNGDGLDDFFVCGAKGQGGSLFLQQRDARFAVSSDSAVFLADRGCEDVDAVFFDANGDGHPDLYVASGGNEDIGDVQSLKDRLYINDGKGHFSLSAGLPALFGDKAVVRVADYDHDGDLDIFIAGRVVAGVYGKPPTSYLLQNDGKGNFTVVTSKYMPGMVNIGMLTDAVWTDVDKDGWPDLLVVGEWLPPILYKNNHGHFSAVDLTDKDDDLYGCWEAMKAVDINGDGFDDFLLGNYGLNSKLAASPAYPLNMYVGDITGSLQMEQIVAVAKNGKYYPFLNKENLEHNLPYLKKEYFSYEKMAGKTLEEVFGDKLGNMAKFKITSMASVALMNDGKGHFTAAPLPPGAQWAPIFSFAPYDYNGDGKLDFLAAGNFFGTIPYEGRYDAMPLALYTGDGRGGFTQQLPLLPPFDMLTGELRSLQPIKLANGKKAVLAGVNNAPLRLYQY